MNHTYTIYNNLTDREKVADIHYNDETNEYTLTPYKEDIHDYPILFQIREPMTSQDLEEFLASRVLPQSRHGLEEQLERLGIKYSWQALIKLNLGRTLTDDFYIITDNNQPDLNNIKVNLDEEILEDYYWIEDVESKL